MSNLEPTAPLVAESLPGVGAKRPWHTPELHQVDYTATEFNIGATDPSDLTGYGSQP